MNLETSAHITSTNSTLPFFIKENISLADKNWFLTGGNARFYCEPETSEQFQQAILWAQRHSLPLFVLGEGANILISDQGFDGLVIRPRNANIEIVSQERQSTLVKAAAGTAFASLINFCLDNNLGGLHEFSGIPGTVGGAVFINIHYFEFLLDAFLVHATIIDKKTGHITTVDKNWFSFGYNYSTLHLNEHYLIDATFRLKQLTHDEASYAKGRRDEMIRYRARRYPTSRTCGSFFRNFFHNEVSLESNGKKLIFVAYYLDQLGFKGQLSHGDALVSHLHANMIVNKGTASTHDIVLLARQMQEAVHKKFGILPQPECRLIGFKNYPLLTL